MDASMRGGLEAGGVPRGVRQRRSINGAELDLRRCASRRNVDGESKLQQLLSVLPLAHRLDPDHAVPRGSRISCSTREVENFRSTRTTGVFCVSDQRNLLGRGQTLPLTRVLLVDIPGVPIGLVCPGRAARGCPASLPGSPPVTNSDR